MRVTAKERARRRQHLAQRLVEEGLAGNPPKIRESTFWYLGSPYSKYPGGLDEAFHRVVQARGLLVKAGIPCFSPVIHSHPVAKYCDIDPYDHKIWLPSEAPMLDASCGLIILMLEGWEASVGLQLEREIFRESRRPEVFMEPGHVPELPVVERRISAEPLIG